MLQPFLSPPFVMKFTVGACYLRLQESGALFLCDPGADDESVHRLVHERSVHTPSRQTDFQHDPVRQKRPAGQAEAGVEREQEMNQGTKRNRFRVAQTDQVRAETDTPPVYLGNNLLQEEIRFYLQEKLWPLLRPLPGARGTVI